VRTVEFLANLFEIVVVLEFEIEQDINGVEVLEVVAEWRGG
jgi:hypothetical protein